MKNIKATVSPDGKTLTLEIDLTQRQGTSASGKSQIVATTSGNIAVPGREDMTLGLNLYTKNQAGSMPTHWRGRFPRLEIARVAEDLYGRDSR